MSDNSHLTALGYAGGGFLIIVYFLWENGEELVTWSVLHCFYCLGPLRVGEG